LEERRTILDACSTNKTECRDGYDGVFLVAHSGECYTKAVSAWTGTPHLRAVSDVSGLVRQILSLLGEPRPLEIERKFLVEYPDIEKLHTLPECASVSISQTYLRAGEGEERRVRKRGTDGSYMYYLTTKSQGDGSVRTEIETRITKEQYESLLGEADGCRGTVDKTRFCILHHQSYIEIDVYPFWSDRAIAEIELCSQDDEFEIPEYIKVIKEVTGESEYKNSSLAKMLART
jgi:CYTH domain-containing protein